MRKALLYFILLVFSFSLSAQMPDEDHRPGGKEFLMSCTYGVLAGTLLGVASLAFVDRPGDNLNRVARGASLGLYSGILLGLYAVYIVPGMDEEEYEDPVVLGPTVNPSGHFDGLQAQWTVLNF